METRARDALWHCRDRLFTREQYGPDLLGRWGAGTEIGTALFWDRA
jgi:hypothetical protein